MKPIIKEDRATGLLVTYIPGGKTPPGANPSPVRLCHPDKALPLQFLETIQRAGITCAEFGEATALLSKALRGASQPKKR